MFLLPDKGKSQRGEVSPPGWMDGSRWGIVGPAGLIP